MNTEIDIESWKRKATYEFFKDFEDPFFNMTANLDVTNLYHFSKENEISFSLACLFYSQEVVNEIPEFKIRLVEDTLVQFEKVDSTQTIIQEDETFSFCYFEQRDSISEFNRDGLLARSKYEKLKTFDVESERLDLIYYSVIPWVSFSSFKHATRFDKRQTVPRIVFGKFFDDQNAKKMPVSVEANHTIMDGIHVGKYFNLFQKKIDGLAA